MAAICVHCLQLCTHVLQSSKDWYANMCTQAHTSLCAFHAYKQICAHKHTLLCVHFMHISKHVHTSMHFFVSILCVCMHLCVHTCGGALARKCEIRMPGGDTELAAAAFAVVIGHCPLLDTSA